MDRPKSTEWQNLKRVLSELTESGSVEVHEDGKWLASLNGFRSELRAQGKHTIVHLWSSEANLVRRIVRVVSCQPHHLQIEVQKFGAGKPGRLEFISAEHHRSAARISREQFKQRFERMLAEQSPDARVDSLSTAADLKRSFSALYTRGIMKEGRFAWAIIAAGPHENASAFEGILGFGLLWLDFARRDAKYPIEGLRIFLPEGHALSTLERAQALSPKAGLEVYEFTEADFRVKRAEISGRGNMESWLAPRRDAELVLASAGETIRRVLGLLPQHGAAIETSVPLGSREISFRFRGLEFASWKEGKLYCGIGDSRQPESPADLQEVSCLLQELCEKRSAGATDAKNVFFRAAPERWLEAMVRSDPENLDASLNPAHLYSQVPAMSAGEHGIIDLLGVTRHGRLVVIELKASEDLQLPLQALDYWLRVRHHLAEGDFQRFGYFSGIELRSEPPLIWLVAPGLQFHPANEIQIRYFAPDIQITRIGLNENWRRGIQVLFRQQA